MEDLDLVRALAAQRPRSRCSPRPVVDLRAALPSARRAAHDAAQRARAAPAWRLGRRPRARRALGTGVSAPAPQLDAAAMARAGARRSGGSGTTCAATASHYALWIASTLGYAAGFVAVPILVGWSCRRSATGLAGARRSRARALWLARGRPRSARVLRFFSRTQVFNAAREIEYELRNDLFAHLQRLPQSFFYRWRTGDLMSRCVNDLDRGAAAARARACSRWCRRRSSTSRRDRRDVRARRASSRCSCCSRTRSSCCIARGFGRAMHGTNLAVQEGLADLSSQLQETISGIAVVKAYAMEDVARRRFEARERGALPPRSSGVVRVNGAMPAITGLLPALGDVDRASLVGGSEIQAGRMQRRRLLHLRDVHLRADLPDLHHGLGVRAGAARHARRCSASTRCSRWCRRSRDRADALPVAALRGEIELRDLTFRYDAGPRAGAARRLAARPGRQRARRSSGRSGSGKTHARVADPAPLRGAGRRSSSSTAST